MKRIFAVFGITLFLFAGGNTPVKAQEGKSDRPLSERNADFAFSLYERALTGEKNGNIFISPYSVSLALTMAYHGARGETKREMAEVLSLQGLSDAEIQRSYRDLLKRLKDIDPKIQLEIANSLWARSGVEIEPAYENMIRKTYEATAKSLDFEDSNASKTINEWVKLNTGGKIDRIVPGRIPSKTIAYLINAIYFKAPWKTPFEKWRTRDFPFHLQDGKTIQHPLMVRAGNFRYTKNDDFQAIRIPYGKKGTAAMYVFLPTKGSDLKKFQSRLNAKNWKRWHDEFERHEQRVTLWLPRFEVRYEASLKGDLIDLGMKRAFGGGADFYSLFRKGLMADNPFIADVRHKTFVEVNEVGTEAAAATRLAFPIKANPTVRVDRPFFFVIHDDATDTILFMGSIVNPAGK
jgi:serpin B